MTCTFFGHHNCPSEIQAKLHEVLIHLIEQAHASCFYVGNQGDYDRLVRRELMELCNSYPQIRVFCVLAYMPGQKNEYQNEGMPTLLPEGIEHVPKRYAICFRNRWMLEHAECVVTYVRYHSNGADRYAEMAEKKGKRVIRL